MAVMSRQTKKRMTKLAYHLLVFGLGFLMIYPVLWMVSGAFKTNYEILNESLKLVPNSFSLDNFRRGWQGFGRLTFAHFFRNSFVITTAATAGITLSSAMVAYAFSRLRFPGRQFFFISMMATLMLPAQVVMIPNILSFEILGSLIPMCP